MFEHETKEAKEKCIEIQNVDSDIFREMLLYFYTGQVDDLKNNAVELYTLADRYLVDSLKTFCTHSMIQCMNIKNAAELYYFGRMKEIPVVAEKAGRVLLA